MPKKKKYKVKTHNPFLVGAFIMSLFSFTMLTAIAGAMIKSTNYQSQAARQFQVPPTQQLPAQANTPEFCNDIYSPVCGTNGRTYPNECYAEQQDAVVACDGTCPCGGNGNAPSVPVQGQFNEPQL